MNNELIKKRFAKNLQFYNDNAKVQKIMALKLVNMTEKNEFDTILEVGCGTGLLTELAVNKFKYKDYYANDLLSQCKEYIYKINKDIKFVSSDAVTTKFDKHYDLIISNAVFQWIDNLDLFIEKLVSNLKPGGILLFSTFGKENFREIYLTTGKTLTYYSKQEMQKILANYQYVIDEDIHITAYKTPVDVLKHIKLTGVNAIETKAWTKNDLYKFENAYRNLCPTAPTLTYNPLYVKIYK